MKLLFVVASLLVLQSAFCDDGGVTDTKKCEDYLPAATCTKLRNLANLLHEKTSIVADAVKDAIAHHKTKASEMLASIKAYMAERFPCDQVLTADICAKILALGNRIKLNALQVRLAIESAVANGATKVQDIYNKAVDFMATEITCSKIFGDVACNNMKSAIQKFKEQTQLLNEAIISAAQKHYTNAKDFLVAVKDTIVEKAVNFKCEDALLGSTCTQLRDLAKKLHLTARQLRTAIEEAVINGAAKAKDIYQKTIEFLTTKINCVGILGAKACTNLQEAAKKLKEQSILIKEAIMAAFLKHANNVKDVIQSVKNTLIEKATNFKCTDVLTQTQCDFLTKLAQRFKLRAGELHKVLVETIVNGTNSAVQIYKVTLGKFIEDAKNVKCEDLVSQDTCNALDAFARNFHIKVQEVTLAVKIAIANGLDTASAIYTSVKNYLVEKISCDNFLPTTICDTFEKLANRLHVSYHKVIEKIRSLAANGVTKVSDFVTRITKYIWGLFFGTTTKRSIKTTPFIDSLMQLVEQVLTIGKDVSGKMVARIKQAIAQGKLTLLTARQYITELIAKYNTSIQSDEENNDDAMATVHKSFIEQLKEAVKKLHGKAKETIEKLLTKSKEQLQKLKDLIKQILGNQGSSDEALDMTHNLAADMARQQLDDEARNAEEEIENMILKELYK